MTAGLWAQSAPRFEVATLKLSPPPEGNLININLGTFRNGRFTMNNVTLNDAIKFAYELVSCPGHNVIESEPSDNYETESDF
ncbi:MAG: hypothetical protein ABI995_13320, partial [Acidobacteriota bacterium]